MARKVIFNKNNTLLVTINKINQMSDYLGDLDDLNKSSYQLPKRSFLGGFAENEYVENGGPADQSAAAATEWLHRELAKARNSLFGKAGDSNDSAEEYGILRFGSVLVADSAVIKRLVVSKLFIPVDSDLDSQSATVLRDNLDSNFYNTSFEGGPIFNTGLTIDSGYIARFSGGRMDVGGRWIVSDSQFRTFFDDSADSVGNYVPAFNFGFTVRDSAYIGTLHGPRSAFSFPNPRKGGFPFGYTFDSSTIDIIGDSAGDSGKSGMSVITRLAPDSGDSSTNIFLNYDSGLFTRVFIDSAVFDSGFSYDSPNPPFQITTLFIDTDSSFDSATLGFISDSAMRATHHGRLDSGFSHTSPFTIYDSTGANIIFGGFMISQHDSDNLL